jgi:hypothetical protein
MASMKSKFLLLLLLLSGICYAIDLPFYARWQSLNTMYYDTLQEGKELSWDEAYRAEFGIKGMVHENIALELATETEQFFDEPQLRLKTLRIGYDTGKLLWMAGTYERGYGAHFGLDRYPILEKGYEPYRYHPMRMNSLQAQISLNDELSLGTELGGNIHNQASALVSLNYSSIKSLLPMSLVPQFRFCLSQDLRAMDNHWRTPVSITALNLTRHWSALTLNLDSAIALLPGWEATEAHHEIFVMTELISRPKSLPAPAIGAVYKKQNYAPFETQQYQIRLNQRLGDYFRLIPLTNLHIIDGEDLWQHRLLTKYYLANPEYYGSSIGIYYDFSYFGSEKGRHTFGLALDFEFQPNY